MTPHDPRLVTMKCAEGLPSMRTAEAGEVLVECIRRAQKEAFRIVHFSIQVNHLHLIVEADDEVALASGMKGLGCRVARGLNGVWQRAGAVFAGRFHDRVLQSLRQVRNALRYVLNNYLKHRCSLTMNERGEHVPDIFSSGIYFDGWTDHPQEYKPGGPGEHVARGGWKISEGWKRRCALISLASVPGAA